jgi:soluble lytic murein transglycosylase-like protein
MNNSKRFGINPRPKALLALMTFGLSLALHSADKPSPEIPASTNGQAEAAVSTADKQRASVAAMADSLARQRASIQRQVAGVQGDGFFTSAPPRPFSEVSPGPGCPPLSDSEVSALVGHAAKKEGLDPDLIRSVIRQESAFQPCAVSAKGALGLMQLMPDTASQLKVVNPFDPSSNVNAGARLLKQLLDRYKGDVALALGAYNAGPANVDAAKGVPNIPETVNYVNQILRVLSDGNSAHSSDQPGIWRSPLSPNGSFDGLNLGHEMINVLNH